MTKETVRRQSKAFDDLTLSNDFIFGAVMGNPTCCKPLIEMIMKKKVEKIEYPDIQKSINVTYDAKGIRLDIYAEVDGVLCDIEMQIMINKHLPRRSRYYQNLMSTSHEILAALKAMYATSNWLVALVGAELCSVH